MTTPTTTSRDELVSRLLALRPGFQRRFHEELDRSLHEELESITIHQLSVLKNLEDSPRPMRDLAHCLGISESSATAAVDRLVKAGLVERSSDPNDRRVVLAALSPAGSDVVARVAKAVRRRVGEMLTALSDAQIAALVDIYETLANGGGGGEGTGS